MDYEKNATQVITLVNGIQVQIALVKADFNVYQVVLTTNTENEIKETHTFNHKNPEEGLTPEESAIKFFGTIDREYCFEWVLKNLIKRLESVLKADIETFKRVRYEG